LKTQVLLYICHRAGAEATARNLTLPSQPVQRSPSPAPVITPASAPTGSAPKDATERRSIPSGTSFIPGELSLLGLPAQYITLLNPMCSFSTCLGPALDLIGSQTLKMKNAKAATTLTPTTYQTTLTKLKVLKLSGFPKTLTMRTNEI